MIRFIVQYSADMCDPQTGAVIERQYIEWQHDRHIEESDIPAAWAEEQARAEAGVRGEWHVNYANQVLRTGLLCAYTGARVLGYWQGNQYSGERYWA